MPEAIPTDKLQPYLLDRLIDEEPEARQESRTARVMTLPQFRAVVLRDLRWLLNASAHIQGELDDFGEATRSVLNYGTMDLSGRMISSLGLADLERNLMAAIRTFEPRILPNTLKVKAIVDARAANPNTIALEIRGELWATPHPEELYIKTEIDLDTGVCEL